MRNQVDHADDQALPARLYNLRMGTWAGRPVQQQELARALGVSKSMVSGWESSRPGTPMPGPEWLYKIATFFSTRRTLDPSIGDRRSPHLVADLDADEAATRDRLFAELESLTRGTRSAPQRNLLKFHPEESIRIIGGELPAEFRSANDPSSPDHVNHVRMMAYADLDSLFEIFGHIRALNPHSDVQIRQPADLDESGPNSHLILVGNLSRVQWADNRLAVDLRVQQPADKGDPDGESFVYVDDAGEQHRRGATLVNERRGNPVTEDIGLLARVPNPINSRFTMTIFSGVLARGVYGTVRALTDRLFAASNQEYLADHFGDAESFGLLIRVAVIDRLVPTPEFRNKGCVIFEYTEPVDHDDSS